MFTLTLQINGFGNHSFRDVICGLGKILFLIIQNEDIITFYGSN